MSRIVAWVCHTTILEATQTPREAEQAGIVVSPLTAIITVVVYSPGLSR